MRNKYYVCVKCIALKTYHKVKIQNRVYEKEKEFNAYWYTNSHRSDYEDYESSCATI
jgi:hypothetical protein